MTSHSTTQTQTQTHHIVTRDATASTATAHPLPWRVRVLPRFRVLRPLARMMALGMISALVLIGPVATAQAHDELASSSPGAETTVEQTPSEIVLTFTNPPSGIGAEIIVSDSTGATWSEGPVTVINNTAVQALKAGAPAGVYTAQWRVVSSDDHPIEGTYSFTSQRAQAALPGAVVDAAATAPAAATSPASETAETDAAEADAGGQETNPASSSGIPAFVAYMAVGGLVIAVVLVLLTRRRLNTK